MAGESGGGGGEGYEICGEACDCASPRAVNGGSVGLNLGTLGANPAADAPTRSSLVEAVASSVSVDADATTVEGVVHGATMPVWGRA
jgi:hypothetical protein